MSSLQFVNNEKYTIAIALQPGYTEDEEYLEWERQRAREACIKKLGEELFNGEHWVIRFTEEIVDYSNYYDLYPQPYLYLKFRVSKAHRQDITVAQFSYADLTPYELSTTAVHEIKRRIINKFKRIFKHD